MGLGHSPQIVTNGLVLAFDIGNGLKNATGNISTNLIQNGNFTGGTGSPQEADSNPTNTIVQLANPGDSSYVLRQNGVYTEYQLNIYSGMVDNTTYVMSGWYAKSSDYNGQDLMFHARTYSSSGAHIATGNDAGTLIYSTVVNGITWEYRYQTIATPSDFNNNFNWYVGYGQPGAHNGYRYYTNLKLEKGTYPSIYNLLGTGSNGECVNGLSYNSSNGGSLSFDGTNDYVNGSVGTLNAPFTFEVFGKFNNTSQYNYEYFGSVGDFSANSMISISKIGTQDGNSSYHGFMYVYTGSGDPKKTNIDLRSTSYQHLTVVLLANSPYIKVYKNGVEGSMVDSLSAPINTNGNFRIGTWANNTWWLNGNIASTKIYNKALTSAEVQQNFNALRSRFSI